jgi:hypothetical protein
MTLTGFADLDKLTDGFSEAIGEVLLAILEKYRRYASLARA